VFVSILADKVGAVGVLHSRSPWAAELPLRPTGTPCSAEPHESLSADSMMGRWESCLLSLSHVKVWSRCKPVRCGGISLLSGEDRSSHQLLVIKFDPQPIVKLLSKYIS